MLAINSTAVVVEKTDEQVMTGVSISKTCNDHIAAQHSCHLVPLSTV